MSRAAHRPFAAPAATTGTTEGTTTSTIAASASREAPLGRRARRAGTVALSSCLIGLLGSSGFVHAQDDTSTSTPTTVSTTPAPDAMIPPTDPNAPATVPGSFSLPLFGVPLTVDITTGPGGVIAGIALNPADGMTATTNRPNKVAFVNEEGTAKVVVRTNGGGQRVEAKAGSLDAFVGQPGGWNGEIFPGLPASVSFAVTSDGGVPGIVVGAISGPSHQVGAVERSTETDDDGDGDKEQQAAVRIQFAQDGMKRTLSIKVAVEIEDGETRAKLRISLSKLRSESGPFTAATVGTEQLWTGVLCDGMPASVAYTVGTGGTIALGAVSPEPKRIKAEGNSVEVRFAGGERVRFTVRGGAEGLAVKVDDKIRCKDAPDPTLNVPVKDDDDSSDGKDGDHGGKPGNGKPGSGKPSDTKPSDTKPGHGKPGDGKPGDGKPGDGKPGDGKPSSGKPGDGKPSDTSTPTTAPATTAPATTAPPTTAPATTAPATTAPATTSAPVTTAPTSTDGGGSSSGG